MREGEGGTVAENNKHMALFKYTIENKLLLFNSFRKTSIKNKHIPPPLQPKPVFSGHRKKFFCFYNFISIDSKWSKTYDFREKITNQMKSFQNTYFYVSEHSATFS